MVRPLRHWLYSRGAVGALLFSLSYRFKATVECERVVVWAFDGTHCVSSYRTAQPSAQFLAQLERELSTEYLQTPWTVAFSVRKMRSNVQLKKKERLEKSAKSDTGVQEEPEVTLTKQEARRLYKEQRKKKVNFIWIYISGGELGPFSFSGRS